MATIVPTQKEDRIVFTSGPKGYSVRDIIDAAHFRGEVEVPWQQLLLRVEAQKKARADDAQPDDAALEAAAVAFRYQYDLITAEETERWLELRGLTLADFGEYFAREYWRQKSSAHLESPDLAYASAPAELRDLLATDLILSGELDRMATRLAWRVAAWEAKDFARDEQATNCSEECANSAHALGRDDMWLSEMQQMEAVYQAHCASVLHDDARHRELTALRLPLTRFEVEMLELESRDSAKEAFLCVRDDGMSMEEVGLEGRYPFHRTQMVLEEISDDLQQKFLSLTPGSLLDPTPREDGFLLTRILEKKEPTLHDADVRERVDSRILERHFSDLASGRIRWSIVAADVPE